MRISMAKLAVPLFVLLAVPFERTSAKSSSAPAIGLSSTSLSFTGNEGGRNPADQHVALKNTGDRGSILHWTATSSQPWLTVSPSSGSLGTSGDVDLKIEVNMTYQLQAWVSSTSTVNAPSPRRLNAAAWAANQMFIWGGSATSALELADGARYDPVTNTWIGTTSTVNAPTARHFATAVWTGGEVVVWGGWSNVTSYVNTGGTYFPDSWLGTTSVTNAPNPREAHSAVWTGAQMIIWGGWNGSSHENTGWRYDPVTNTWIGQTSTQNAPDARQEHAAAWDGQRMIIWGGRNTFDINTGLGSGAFYDPGSDTWTGPTSMVNSLSPRTGVRAVWTGREMLIWGGHDDTGPLNTGARYDPVHDTWLAPITTNGAPSPRFRHSAVWTGAQMIIWGGEDSNGALNTGAIYQPPIPALGVNTATITISDPAATNNPQTITVQLIVTP